MAPSVIAGIVVGAVVGLLLVVVLAAVLWMKMGHPSRDRSFSFNAKREAYQEDNPNLT